MRIETNLFDKKIIKGISIPMYSLYGAIDGFSFYIPVKSNFSIGFFCVHIYTPGFGWYKVNSDECGIVLNDGKTLIWSIKKVLRDHPEILHNLQQAWNQSRYDYKLPKQKLVTSYETCWRACPNFGQRCKSQLEIKAQPVRPEKYHYERMGKICAY